VVELGELETEKGDNEVQDDGEIKEVGDVLYCYIIF